MRNGYIYFSYFPIKTYVMGTQKSRLKETVLSSTKIHVKIDGKILHSKNPFLCQWPTDVLPNLDDCNQIMSMSGSRGGWQGVWTPRLKNHKHLGFLRNTGPDPVKNRKTTKPAFNVGPLSACQRNAIYMAFRWRVDDGPLIELF